MIAAVALKVVYKPTGLRARTFTLVEYRPQTHDGVSWLAGTTDTGDPILLHVPSIRGRAKLRRR